MTIFTDGLLAPFALEFVQRAWIGGSLVAVLCGVVGTWVVIRGMAFLGEALAHGMLPGVALATVLGLPVIAGGAVSAVAMSVGIGALQRRGKFSYDTSISGRYDESKNGLLSSPRSHNEVWLYAK